MLGNGDGTFQAKRSFASGSAPCDVAVGDFNGDGVTDLVSADRAGNTASVLLGNGTTVYGLQPITGVSLVTQADSRSRLKVRSTATWIASTRSPGRSERPSAVLRSRPASHHPLLTSRRPPRLASPTHARRLRATLPVWPPFICHTWYYTAQDDDLEQWELQPRFRLPRHYRQLEVPSVVQRRDWYYLFVSSQDRPQETDNAAMCEWPRSPSIIVATHTTTPLPSISQCPKTPDVRRSDTSGASTGDPPPDREGRSYSAPTGRANGRYIRLKPTRLDDIER